MVDKPGTGLAHLPSRGALALGGTRSGIIARGRRDAGNSATQPDYLRGVAAYEAGDLAAAAEHFRRAAEQAHVESQYLLSTLLEAGQGLAKNTEEAAHWERLAADQGHLYAQANVSFRYYAAANFVESFAWCQRAADSNLAWAQHNLGLMFQKGEGTPPSATDAAYWFRQAANQDYPEAQQKLGTLFYFGLGLPRDYSEAAHWFRKAAEQGNAEAQFQLGSLYELGLGVEPDYAAYRHWIRQAALQGHEEAVRELARRQYRDA